jgi:hypothetical protein
MASCNSVARLPCPDKSGLATTNQECFDFKMAFDLPAFRGHHANQVCAKKKLILEKRLDVRDDC